MQALGNFRNVSGTTPVLMSHQYVVSQL